MSRADQKGQGAGSINPALLVLAEQTEELVDQLVPSLLGPKELCYSCRVFGRRDGRIQVEVSMPSGGVACCVDQASTARFIALAFTQAAEILEGRES